MFRWESIPRGFSACAWKLRSRLFFRPDWPPLGVRGWNWEGEQRKTLFLQYFANLAVLACSRRSYGEVRFFFHFTWVWRANEQLRYIDTEIFRATTIFCLFPLKLCPISISLVFCYNKVVFSFIRGTQRQFSENICSEDDFRSRIFGTFVVKFLACLPLLGFSNI